MMIVTQVFFFPNENLGEKARADVGSQESWVQATKNRSGCSSQHSRKGMGCGPSQTHALPVLKLFSVTPSPGPWQPPGGSSERQGPGSTGSYYGYDVSHFPMMFIGHCLWMPVHAFCLFPLVCLFLNDLSNALYILDINPMSLRCWKYLHLVCY